MLLPLFLTSLILSSAHSESLIPWSEQILAQVKSTEFNQATCPSYLRNLEKKIDQLKPSLVGSEILGKESSALLKNFWSIRLALHEHLDGTHPVCTREIRNSLRLFRFLEDFVAEVKTKPENLDPETLDYQSQPTPLREDASFYLTQKSTSGLDLHEGDLIIARGVSFMSAMIARLGDVNSQFSHVITVVRDPQTHLLETVESYVGEGVNFHEMNWALKNSNSRLLVLRPHNQTLAKKAARDLWEYVNAHQGANRIHYDYSLDFKDPETMSCAEVAQFAYSKAGEALGTPFSLPEQESTLTHGRDLLQRLGIEPGDTFTPGDLEGDSRFEMIAEFRDLRLTLDSRQRDAILTKALEWMDKDAATLHSSMKSKMAQGPIWTLRRTFLWPTLRKLMKLKDFSKEVPRNMLGTVELVTELGDGVLKELKLLDDARFVQTGLHSTYLEIYDDLEKIKQEDEARFENKKTRKYSIIFKFLRS